MANSGFVYIWYDRKHKRFYIGSHWGPEDDGYICSSWWMKRAYKIRPQDFKRKILARIFSTRLDLLVEEQRWLSMIKDSELRTRYYNIRRSDHLWHADPSKSLSIAQKISKTKTGKKWSKTQREAFVNSNREEFSHKVSEGLKSAYQNGHSHPKGMLGKKMSIETKQKMSESHKGLLKGIPKSEEHKHKLSQARIGKEPWNKGKSYGKTPWIDAGVSRTTWYRHAMHKDAFSRKG